MNQLIQALNDTIAQGKILSQKLTDSILQAQEVLRVADERGVEADRKMADLVGRESSLDLREKAVVRVENIAKAELDNKRLSESLNQGIDKLASDKAEFESYKTATLKDISSKQSKFNNDNEVLAKSWKDLRAKEQSYKEEIQNVLRKRLG